MSTGSSQMYTNETPSTTDTQGTSTYSGEQGESTTNEEGGSTPSSYFGETTPTPEGEDNDKEKKEQELNDDIIEEPAENEKIISDLVYFDYTKKDITLPKNFGGFKLKFIKEYAVEKQIFKKDKMLLNYIKEINDKPAPVEVETEEDYQEMMKYFLEKKEKDKNKEKANKPVIRVDTEKIPLDLKMEEPIEFEDEIKNYIKKEIKILNATIIKQLTTNAKYTECKQPREEICQKCEKQIIGYLFKDVGSDEMNFYCENCAKEVEIPVFKINY